MERYIFILVVGIAVMTLGGFGSVLGPVVEGLAGSVGSLGRTG